VALRPGRLIFAVTIFGALAVGVTGTYLLARYRSAVLAAAADREQILVGARAHVIGHELEALVQEIARLSRLAEIDLADGSLEPEKSVLRIARKDSAVFSIAIAILDRAGTVLWAEPQGARPVSSGAALVGLARGAGRPSVHASAGEIAVAAPIAGRGAIVALVPGGDGARRLFGPELAAAIAGGGEVEIVIPAARAQRGAVVVAALRGPPPAPPALDTYGAAQAWVEDGAGSSWLVTAADIEGSPLQLRLVQRSSSVEGGLSAPFRRLVLVVLLAVALAVVGGAALGAVLRRLEHTELLLARAQDLAAMGRTAAAIAHEVKNGLNGLSIAVDVLAGGKGDPEVRRGIHAQARAEVARLRDVADDLTMFASPPRLSPTEVDLVELCRRAAASVEGAAAEAGVEVALALPDGSVPLRADPAKLVGALSNLARNGVEAMGPGAFGEPLGAPPPARERRLELSLDADGIVAVVTVADRGPGIAPEVRGKIFEPFVTTKRTGTGLGLAIARRVVEAHGGTLAVEDRPGGGALFRVTLPRTSI
jgi:signal transduction histidine kinase